MSLLSATASSSRGGGGWHIYPHTQWYIPCCHRSPYITRAICKPRLTHSLTHSLTKRHGLVLTMPLTNHRPWKGRSTKMTCDSLPQLSSGRGGRGGVDGLLMLVQTYKQMWLQLPSSMLRNALQWLPYWVNPLSKVSQTGKYHPCKAVIPLTIFSLTVNIISAVQKHKFSHKEDLVDICLHDWIFGPLMVV